jgi:hypothetical protein
MSGAWPPPWLPLATCKSRQDGVEGRYEGWTVVAIKSEVGRAPQPSVGYLGLEQATPLVFLQLSRIVEKRPKPGSYKEGIMWFRVNRLNKTGYAQSENAIRPSACGHPPMKIMHALRLDTAASK